MNLIKLIKFKHVALFSDYFHINVEMKIFISTTYNFKDCL